MNHIKKLMNDVMSFFFEKHFEPIEPPKRLEPKLREDTQFTIARSYFIDSTYVSGCTHIRDFRI